MSKCPECEENELYEICSCCGKRFRRRIFGMTIPITTWKTFSMPSCSNQNTTTAVGGT